MGSKRDEPCRKPKAECCCKVAAVSRSRRFVFLANDQIARVETMLDEIGDETDDPSECVGAVGQLPCGRWFHLDVRGFGPTPLQ